MESVPESLEAYGRKKSKMEIFVWQTPSSMINGHINISYCMSRKIHTSHFGLDMEQS